MESIINNSKILKESKISGDNKIVAIRVNSKNYDKAVKILELLVNKYDIIMISK